MSPRHPFGEVPHDDGGPAGDYDALADLFLAPPPGPALRLARPDDPAPHSAAGAGPVTSRQGAARRIEGIVLGHLPVLGAGWVVQYARHVADQVASPVALLRLLGGEAWLDLVLPQGTTTKPGPASRVGPGAGDLSSALAQAADDAGAWLVRVDDGAEPELRSLPGLSHLTLLSGADTPAVVAAYNAIRRFADSPSTHTATLGLAIMGADAASADSAEQRLASTVRAHLGRELAPAVRIDRIGACTTQSLFRGKATQGLHALMAGVVRGATRASAHEAPDDHNAPEVIVTHARRAPATREPGDVAANAAGMLLQAGLDQTGLGEPRPARHAQPVAAQPVVTVGGVHAPGSSPSGGPPPRASEPVRGVSQDARPKPGPPGDCLASLLPGLTPLRSRCPHAPTVQLAADGEGVLHLLASAGDASPERSAGHLLAAAAWADAHAGLLEDASAERLRGVAARGAVLHAFTRDARSARGLLDTGLCVHLIVEVDGARIAADLN